MTVRVFGIILILLFGACLGSQISQLLFVNRNNQTKTIDCCG